MSTTIGTVVEQKYCERCGMAFMRQAGSMDRYCRIHRDLQPLAEENARKAMTVTRVRSRVFAELQWLMHNGGFGTPRATALADALILLDSANRS